LSQRRIGIGNTRAKQSKQVPQGRLIRTAIAREKLLKGWRREKKLNLIRTIHPEFKDLAQTWGWKMTTVHEKMYP